jgi:thioredoxin 1
MSESTDDDIERIREQKREELADADTPEEPVEVSGADDLQSTVSEHDVVLVDCYADWCGPCKMMEPVVADIAADTDATVAKVDVDQNQEIAGQLGAQSIPTFVLYVDGEPTERLVGAQDEDTFRQLIQQAQ